MLEFFKLYIMTVQRVWKVCGKQLPSKKNEQKTWKKAIYKTEKKNSGNLKGYQSY